MKFTLEEMNGLLNGKCLPSDLIVGETLAEYLARKFSALERSLVESERYGRQTDITIDNLEMQLIAEREAKMALAAENAGLKAALNKIAFTYPLSPQIHEMTTVETPTTDAFLAEVRYGGVEMFAASLKVAGGHEHPYSAVANEFAAQLRKGVQS